MSSLSQEVVEVRGGEERRNEAVVSLREGLSASESTCLSSVGEVEGRVGEMGRDLSMVVECLATKNKARVMERWEAEAEKSVTEMKAELTTVIDNFLPKSLQLKPKSGIRFNEIRVALDEEEVTLDQLREFERDLRGFEEELRK